MMMRLIPILFFALGGPSHAGLVWKSKSIELKSEPGQSSATVEFAFRNTGTDPVEIKSVRTSCSCTTAVTDRQSYAPGEEGSIKGEFDFGPREGVHTKLFRVLTSDGKHETLYFTVDIPTLYQLSAKQLVWTASGGNAKPKVCKLVNQSSRSIKIKSVKGSNSKFTTAIREVRSGFEYELTVAPAGLSDPSRSVITISTEPTPGNEPIVYRIYTVVR